MQPILFWPALVLVAGAVTAIPVVQNGSNRSFLYWVVLPSIVVGVAAFFTRLGAF
jgi:hypothetical protein